MSKKIHPPDLSEPVLAIQQLAADLRDQELGCPWDKEQNHQTMIKHLVEETYEVVDAIQDLLTSVSIEDAYRNLKEELGDLLFQVVFHCQLAREKNHFDLNDVARAITEKLIYRHPHVYGDIKAENSQAVLTNWEQLKRKERESREHDQSVLSGVASSMPALQKSYRIGQKVSRLNFDWESNDEGLNQLRAKVLEEFQEVANELPVDPAEFKKDSLQKERAELEVGDLLFSIAQFARKYHINPEEALQKANQKFKVRFQKAEEHFSEKIAQGALPSLEEWEEQWRSVKSSEKSL